MHYKTRANCYMVLGGVWLVAVLASVIVGIWGVGGFHALVIN